MSAGTRFTLDRRGSIQGASGRFGSDPKIVDLLASVEQSDQPSWLLAAT
jgi:hypothetical protein